MLFWQKRLLFCRNQKTKNWNKHLQALSAEVERDWHYWRPIAYGVVKIDKKDYDAEGPLFLLKLNFAMNYRNKIEKEEIEKSKNE